MSFPSPHGLRWMVGEGALLPLHVGSAGRVLIGELGPRGWVETVEEREPGVASVSAPVAAPAAGVLAAVSVGGPIERLDRANRASASATTSSRPPPTSRRRCERLGRKGATPLAGSKPPVHWSA